MATVDTLFTLLQSSPDWDLIRTDIPTWQHSERISTPPTQSRQWPESTFTRRVAISIVGKVVLLRIDRAPWVSTATSKTSVKQALSISASPESAFSEVLR